MNKENINGISFTRFRGKTGGTIWLSAPVFRNGHYVNFKVVFFARLGRFQVYFKPVNEPPHEFTFLNGFTSRQSAFNFIGSR